MLGSVGTRLLHGAPCGVAVAPVGYAETVGRAIRVVAVAYDASPESRTAVLEAASLATAAGAALRIIAVADTATVGSAVAIAWAAYDELVRAQRDHLETKVDQLISELPSELNPSARIAVGNPVSVILLEADQGADLLVVGSRGYGALRRVMLGSVSAELMRSAPCPVLVMPRGAHAPAADTAPAPQATEGA